MVAEESVRGHDPVGLVDRAVVGVVDVGLDDVLEPGPAVPAVEEAVENGADDLDADDEVPGEDRLVDDLARRPGRGSGRNKLRLAVTDVVAVSQGIGGERQAQRRADGQAGRAPLGPGLVLGLPAVLPAVEGRVQGEIDGAKGAWS